ncbi:MAG: class IV adenylate cyclase [Candidatus Woesearchaeota archaeon]|jgi:adenylate cyclase class 2|nr:class IV adenylate cyclase [Candidatus Woesearchaeota archaeon]MDP7458195.1 class IV adenylate cyclase [Candidatus Woesearchaeota archaeon]
MKEIEVKAKLPDATEVINQLTALGCVFSDPIIQKDTIFVPKPMGLPVPMGTNVLRIRDNNGEIQFNLKQPQKNEFDCIESEVVVSDAGDIRKIIEALDFHEVVKFTKTRRKCKHKEYEICVDDVVGLGGFIEVEKLVSDDEDSIKVQDELFEFLKQFDIKKEDRVFKGYDRMVYNLKNKE